MTGILAPHIVNVDSRDILVLEVGPYANDSDASLLFCRVLLAELVVWPHEIHLDVQLVSRAVHLDEGFHKVTFLSV